MDGAAVGCVKYGGGGAVNDVYVLDVPPGVEGAPAAPRCAHAAAIAVSSKGPACSDHGRLNALPFN